MPRITISIDAELAAAFDAIVRDQGYASRSEALRDLIRTSVDTRAIAANPAGHCVAVLSYVYDHDERALPARLAALGHAHHDLVVATTHVHLDHHDCLESTVLRGETGAVRAFADGVQAERGVRMGALAMVAVDRHDDHAHAGAHTHVGNAHSSPRRG